jgi:glucose/arabinose dehydrogenase
MTRRRWVLAAATTVAVLAASAAPAGAVTLPASFTDEVVATVPAPTALAFTPDGRMLIATQPGQLRVVSGGALLGSSALDLSTVICTESERGLLGVAVDPQFAVNRFIYVYYTFKRADPCSGTNAVNRVSRFVLSDANTVDPAGQLVLVDSIPSPAGNHNGGDLQFGNDGNLYISVGDGGCDYAGGGCAGANDAARDENVLLGKVLRITPAGAIPASNPFQGLGTGRCNLAGSTTAARCQETFAWGLRNPFRMAFDPNAAATRFYINDVGQGVWEEIDAGLAGADYGWNVREGHCLNGSLTNCPAPPAGMTDPIYDYDHASTGCASITGGAFVPNGAWPATYDGAYLFGDYICGRIFALTPAGTRTTFADQLGAGSAVHLAFGPHAATQALYYTSYLGGGAVHRIAYAAPATPPAGGPVDVADPPPAAGPAAAGNAPPQPVITSPAATRRFAVGQPISLRGNAVDREDGTLPPSRLSWRVLRRHGAHTHRWFGPVTASSTAFTAPPPEGLAATANSSLKIVLTATDSSGATTTVSRTMRPRLVNVTFTTSPRGLALQLNGRRFAAPRTWRSWAAWKLRVSARNQAGRVFRRWSDGRGRTHAIRTPSSARTYTATFRRR